MGTRESCILGENGEGEIPLNKNGKETERVKNSTTCSGCQLFEVVYMEQSHKSEPCARVAFGKAVNGWYLRNTRRALELLQTQLQRIEMELCLRTVLLDHEVASS